MKSVAATVRDRVEKAPPGAFFRTDDFPGPRSAVETHLSRLTKRDSRLLRVRRGLYWKGVSSRFGAGRPRLDDIVLNVAGSRGIGPTGWTAGHALGLSTQVPAIASYVVVGPAPTNVPGAKFHTRWNLERRNLRFHEIALLEVLRDWPASVESDWTKLVSCVADHRKAGLIRPTRMRKVVDGEPKPVVREHFAKLVRDLISKRPVGTTA